MKPLPGGEEGERLAAFLQRLMPMIGAPNVKALAVTFGIAPGAVYRYAAGAPNATARHVATICDAVGISVARVMLGPGNGRVWFVDPRLAGLDFESPRDRGDVVKAVMDALHHWQKARAA